MKKLLMAMIIVCSLSSLALAKGGGGGHAYVWEAKTPEERISDYLRRGPEAYMGGCGWGVLAYWIPEELKGVKKINPELKGKLLKHASAMLEQLKKSENPDEINEIVGAIAFYEKRIGFKTGVNIDELATRRLVVAGKKAIAALKMNRLKWHVINKFDIDPRPVNRDCNNILYEINVVLQSGVTLNEIGVPSSEAMRDLAAGR